MDEIFINPIDYYKDCCGCIFRNKCEVKWDNKVPYHIDNGGQCPDEFEFNINELNETQ